jgi:hypothetical protein
MSVAPQRRARRSSKIATAAEYASLSFEGVRADEPEGGRSEADWIEAAKHEFFLFQCAVKLLAKNDVEMAEAVQRTGAESFLALSDSATELAKKYKTGAKVLESVTTRVLCGLSRLPGMTQVEL